MKKFGKVLIAVLVCVLMLSAVACDPDTDTGTETDPVKMKSERVNAEQWEAAFDFGGVTNVTLKLFSSVTYEDEESPSEDNMNTEIKKYDGDKIQTCVSASQATTAVRPDKEFIETFSYKDGNKIYRYEYSEKNQAWSRYEDTNADLTQWDVSDKIGGIVSYAEEFDKFTYDDDKKSYVYDETETNALWDSIVVSIKIVGGKFAYGEMICVRLGRTYFSSAWMYDLGKTSVTLPTVANNSENE